MSVTKTVYEVLYDSGHNGGPTADGTEIARFGKYIDAQRFASDKTCYGKPASILSVTVSRRLAQRWGF